MRHFYLIAAVLGAVLPWSTFLPYLMEHGLNPISLLAVLYGNGAVAGLSTDFFITCVIFSVFAWQDASEHQVRGWWFVVPAAPLIGLSMAVPAYFYLRERSKEKRALSSS